MWPSDSKSIPRDYYYYTGLTRHTSVFTASYNNFIYFFLFKYKVLFAYMSFDSVTVNKCLFDINILSFYDICPYD